MNRIHSNFAVFAAFVCLSVTPVFSQALTDHYIILFKADAGVIDPPDPANVGKVPVVEPTSGQSKEALAAVLGLNGEITAILEVNNGIVVRIDAQEAARWRQDVRVARVDQSIEGSFMAMQGRTDYPVYRDGILTIPRVDTDEQPGAFLDGVFIFDSNSNSWQLLEFKSAELTSTSGRSVFFLQPDDGVVTHITESVPVQVFLDIRGHLSNGCLAIGGTHQRLKNSRFEITVNAVSTVPDDGSVACTQALVPFEKMVPLQVYGLSMGIYSYIVNGEIEGSFELTEDNTL